MKIELEIEPCRGWLLDDGESFEGFDCRFRLDGERLWRKFTLVVDERASLLSHLEAALTVAAREAAGSATRREGVKVGAAAPT